MAARASPQSRSAFSLIRLVSEQRTPRDSNENGQFSHFGLSIPGLVCELPREQDCVARFLGLHGALSISAGQFTTNRRVASSAGA